MTKRSRLEIMKDILEVIKNNKNMIKPTPLLRKSGLSSRSFREYYAMLLERQLISEISDGKDKKIKLSEKGFRFMDKYQTIINFIDEFEL